MSKADRQCCFCESNGTFNCPNSYFCYAKEDKPFFKLRHIYKSKFICKDKVYYNIHHFNKFQKLLAKIIWRIKIEDVGGENE